MVIADWFYLRWRDSYNCLIAILHGYDGYMQLRRNDEYRLPSRLVPCDFNIDSACALSSLNRVTPIPLNYSKKITDKDYRRFTMTMKMRWRQPKIAIIIEMVQLRCDNQNKTIASDTLIVVRLNIIKNIQAYEGVLE